MSIETKIHQLLENLVSMEMKATRDNKDCFLIFFIISNTVIIKK